MCLRLAKTEHVGILMLALAGRPRRRVREEDGLEAGPFHSPLLIRLQYGA
jgi:hypothetical protein